MASSDSEEDIHQCGRCKETFVSLEKYFIHKKSKTCRKSKAPRLSKLGFLDEEIPASADIQNEAERLAPSIDCSRSNHQEDNVTEIRQDCETQENTDAEIKPKTGQAQINDNMKQPSMKSNTPASAECDTDVPSQIDKNKLTSDQSSDSTSITEQYSTKQPIKQRLRTLPRKSKIISDYATLTKHETHSNQLINSNQRLDKHVPLRKRKLKIDFHAPSEQNAVETSPLEPVTKCPRPNNFKCSECEFTALYKDEYTAHLYNAHKISDKTCPTCNKPFRYKHRLQQHILSKKCQKDGANITHKTTATTQLKTIPEDASKNQTNFHDNKVDIHSHGNECMVSMNEKDSKVNTVGFKHKISTQRKIKNSAPNDDSYVIDMDKATKPRKSTRKSVKNKNTKVSILTKDKVVARKQNQNNMFDCPVCGKHFKEYLVVKNHMEEHHPATYCGVCKLCGKYYPTKYKLWRHMTSNLHKGLVPLSDIIEAKVDLMNEPVARRGRPSKSNGLTCVACQITFKTKHELHEHVNRLHSNRKNTKCPFCSQVFPTETVYRKHVTSVHKIDKEDFNKQKCAVCNKSFSHKHHALRHKLKMHKPQLPHSYDVKGYDPSAEFQIEALNEDEAVHHDGSSEIVAQKCFLCCEYFINREKLNMHLEYHKVWVPSNDEVVMDAVYQSIFKTNERVVEESMNKNLSAQEIITPAKTDKELDEGDNNKIDTIDDDNATHYDAEAQFEIDIHANKKDNGDNVDENAIEEDGNNVSVKNDKKYACPYCFKQFADWENIKQHKIVDHDLKLVFKCIKEECLQIFETVNEYKEHNSTHPQRAFICISCNDHFCTYDFLTMHRLGFHIQRTDGFKCYGCGELFASSDERKVHETTVEHTFQCKTCRRAFKTESNLKSHELFHSNLKHFLCDQCGAGFTNKHALKRHILIHNPTDKFPCPTCGKVFTKRDHMKRHLVTTHGTHKLFRCTFTGCDRAYKRKDKLKEHLRTHSNEPLFICQFCSRAFKYKQALQYHEKTHAKERRRECSQCEALFYSLSDLKEHFQKDHNIKMKSQHHTNVCPKCKLSFTRVERLYRHIEKVHKDFKSKVTWTTKCHLCQKGFAGDKSLSTHMEKRHSIRKSSKNNVAAVPTNDPIANACLATKLHKAGIIQPSNQAQKLDNPAILNRPEVYMTSAGQKVYESPVMNQEKATNASQNGIINTCQEGTVNAEDNTDDIPNSLLILQLDPKENVQSFQRHEHYLRDPNIPGKPNIPGEPSIQGEFRAGGKEPSNPRQPIQTRNHDLPTLRSQLDLHDPNYFVRAPTNQEKDPTERSDAKVPYDSSGRNTTPAQRLLATNLGLYTTQGFYPTTPAIYTTNSGLHPNISGLHTTYQSSELYSLDTSGDTPSHSKIKTQQKPNSKLAVLPPGSTLPAPGPHFIPPSHLPQPTYGYHGARVFIPEGESQGSAILKSVAMQPVNHHDNRLFLPKQQHLAQELVITEHNKSKNIVSPSEEASSSSSYSQSFYNVNGQS